MIDPGARDAGLRSVERRASAGYPQHPARLGDRGGELAALVPRANSVGLDRRLHLERDTSPAHHGPGRQGCDPHRLADWGWAGGSNFAYVIADAQDDSGSLAGAERWRRRLHLGCPLVYSVRIRAHLYFVETSDCTFGWQRLARLMLRSRSARHRPACTPPRRAAARPGRPPSPPRSSGAGVRPRRSLPGSDPRPPPARLVRPSPKKRANALPGAPAAERRQVQLEHEAAERRRVERTGMVGRGDDRQRMAIEPGEQFVDLPHLPARARGGAVEQQRVGFVEQQHTVAVTRLGKSGGDLRLCLADPLRQQIGRTLDYQRAIECAGEMVRERGLAGAGRAGEQ